MIGLTLLATTILTMTALVVLCAVATRDSALLPATVNPFTGTPKTDASADTLVMGCAATATLAGDWHATEVQTLHEVENILDWLENHNVRQSELQSADGKFVVRWR